MNKIEEQIRLFKQEKDPLAQMQIVGLIRILTNTLIKELAQKI